MYKSIQYLRAVAAIMVVLTHVSFKLEVNNSNILNWFSIGQYGVDLFFIISGFIMCHSVENKKTTFSGFMKARVQRIFPLYWILTILALIVFILKPSLVNSSGGETSLFSSFTLIPTGEKLLINNGWTLSFEFLFYLIFAFSINISSKYKLLSSIILLSMVLIGAVLNVENPQLVFITSPLLIEFILGILAYKIITDIGVSKKTSYLLIVLSIFLLGFLNYYGPIENIFGRSLYAGIPMFLLFVGFVSLEEIFKGKNKWLYGIGMSSYSLYLIHPFALSGVTLLFKKTGMIDHAFLYASSMIFIACIIGWLCFCFVEKPIAAFILTRKKLERLDNVSVNT